MFKKLYLTMALGLVTLASFAQSADLPTTEIRDLNGKQVAFNESFEKGKVTLVSFWATWCIPCKREIKNIQKKMPEWQKEADFNYMTVSVDDARNIALVKTFVKSQGWKWTTLVDANSDLKRSLNFQNVPFSMIVDQNGKIVYQHTGYEEGSENELFAKIKELSKK